MKVQLVVDSTLAADSVHIKSPVKVPIPPSRLRFGGGGLRVSSIVTRATKPDLCLDSESPACVPSFSPSADHEPDVAGGANGDATVCVGRYAQERLSLPESGTLHVRVLKDRVWHLGPCLAFYSQLTHSELRPFGEQTQMFADLSVMGKQLGVDVIVQTPGDPQEKLGWRYSPENDFWIRQTSPAPDVVIRRSGMFPAVDMQSVVRDLTTYKTDGKLHSLPRICGNKWALYQAFRETSSALGALFPETKLAESPEVVYDIAMSRGDVYVKPLTGAQGILVFHLTRHHGRLVAAYEERWSPSQRVPMRAFETHATTREFRDAADFKRFWRTTGLMRCLVQDTVVLPRTRSHEPFDFRWLVQDCGQLEVVARVARIGQPGAVTTNIHTGARAMQAADALRLAGWSDAESMIAQLDRAALQAANELRQRYGPFAEVGVDLAIGEDNRVFVFEANPTPGRRMLRSLSGSVREMSLQCLLEYAIRATGFEP